MGVALSPNILSEIVAKREAGASFSAISNSLEISYGATWKWWSRYKKQGEAGLKPRYANCGKSGPPRDCLIYRAACWLKRLHPDWGSNLIWAILKERYPEYDRPTPRTFNRWFRKVGLSLPKTKFPREPKVWAKSPHDTWQVDAKEQVRIGSGEQVCWITVVDEKTSSLLKAVPFPPQEDLSG
jgi:transposase